MPSTAVLLPQQQPVRQRQPQSQSQKWDAHACGSVLQIILNYARENKGKPIDAYPEPEV